MKIHEYQAKHLLSRYGIPVPESVLVVSAGEAEQAARKLAGPAGKVVLKAQVHAGGRGEAGGVKVVEASQAAREAERILGKPLVTRQTGPEGKVVKKLLVEQALRIERELYLSMVFDRERERIVAMACAEGGVEIEQLARTSPDKILIEPLHPVAGLLPFQVRRMGYGMGLGRELVQKLVGVCTAMSKAFVELDAQLVEINPLVVTGEGDIVALDAKMNFDDNALWRQEAIAELRDPDEEHPAEVEASRHNLSYVHLDGNIGCMVNGAGLAMATMDLIKLYGGQPANFLDVGGGTDAKRVEAAFKIILADPNVRAVLVNIFGGIVRCDLIAEGIVAAAREVKLEVPLVVRLQGTLADEGRRILADSGLAITPAEHMSEAARLAVEAAGGGK